MKRDQPPITLTIDEYRVLKRLADQDNLSIGAIVRRLIAQEAYRCGLLPPSDQHVQAQMREVRR